MSHSITTTTSYVLNKYSRSYPSTSLQGPVESDWQHFTNPVMRIIPEAKKSPSGELVSMRLRILWSIQVESSDLYVNQSEVVFEDLELLSFSSLPTSHASAALQSDQGLPLKAVYRDAVVGIRYLHPKLVVPGSQPTYRRFQVTFKNTQDASQFIDAIKSVCPCKANPQPVPINRHSTILSTSLARSATTAPGPASVRHARLTERQNTIASTSVDPWPAPLAMSCHLRENQGSSVASTSLAASFSSDDSAFVTCSETSHRADSQAGRHQKDGLPKNRGRDSAPSSLPDSSQPSSSDQSIVMPPPPVPQRATHSDDAPVRRSSGTENASAEKSQLLASLSEHPSLYELSVTELETLVSQVIREEGFIQLLDSLDSLWRVKGLLGR